MTKKNLYSDEIGSPYDPMNVAKAEGRIFGVGVSGKYKKTKVVRLGFFLLGLSISCMGGVLSASTIVIIFKDGVDLAERVAWIVPGLVGLAALALGLTILKRVID